MRTSVLSPNYREIADAISLKPHGCVSARAGRPRGRCNFSHAPRRTRIGRLVSAPLPRGSARSPTHPDRPAPVYHWRCASAISTAGLIKRERHWHAVTRTGSRSRIGLVAQSTNSCTWMRLICWCCCERYKPQSVTQSQTVALICSKPLQVTRLALCLMWRLELASQRGRVALHTFPSSHHIPDTGLQPPPAHLLCVARRDTLASHGDRI